MRMLTMSWILGAQVAELAGIMGAKYTCFLIPLCHNISLKCGRTDPPHVLLQSCPLLRTCP
jgi:MoaC family